MGFLREAKKRRLAKKGKEGDTQAYSDLCDMLLFDKKSTPEEQEQGYKLAQSASAKGGLLASFSLWKIARCYEQGIVVEKDPDKARAFSVEAKSLNTKAMSGIIAKIEKNKQEPKGKTRWDKQREAKAKSAKAARKATDDRKYNQHYRYCVTCNYWEGARTIEPTFYRYVTLDNDADGLCLSTNSSMLRHKMRPSASCPHYERWILLKG